MKTGQKRERHFDTDKAKGIAILTVIMGHIISEGIKNWRVSKRASAG